jgi:hypothetical protein
VVQSIDLVANPHIVADDDHASGRVGREETSRWYLGGCDKISRNLRSGAKGCGKAACDQRDSETLD